jgi:hypothetical protein
VPSPVVLEGPAGRGEVGRREGAGRWEKVSSIVEDISDGVSGWTVFCKHKNKGVRRDIPVLREKDVRRR